jgi:hypothetical protein
MSLTYSAMLSGITGWGSCFLLQEPTARLRQYEVLEHLLGTFSLLFFIRGSLDPHFTTKASEMPGGGATCIILLLYLFVSCYKMHLVRNWRSN